MKTLRFILFIIMAMFVGMASAQTSVSLQVQRQVVEGRKFTVTIRVINGQANAPQPPQIQNCKLLYGPSTSTMSSIQIVNGQQTSSTTVDYTFTYIAEKAGTTTVPAVTINSGGKQYSTSATQLTILPPDKNTSQQNQSSGGQSGVDITDINSQQAGKSVSSDDLFVRISLSKTTAYEQEAIIATVKVYTKYNISSFMATQQPTFEGFLSEELAVNDEPQIEHVNGQNYTSAVLKRCIIFPQKTGKLTINSGKFDVTIVQYETVSNGWFTTRRPVEQHVKTQSNTATVNVIPLPEPRPASFIGAVGDFTASAVLSPTELKTNEATSYIFTVKGQGNVKYLQSPTLNLPAGIDEYTPKTDIDARFNGSTIAGTYKVTYTLVPQEPGTFEIPGWEFTYFNPQTKEYKSIPIDPINIKVAKGTSTSVATEQNTIAGGMDDILHIKSLKPGQQRMEPEFVMHQWWYTLLYVLTILSFIAVIFIYRRQLKLNADITGRKMARANKEANKRLAEAKKWMNKHNSDKFYESLGSALWGYISDKLGIPASGLVRDNIAEQLAAAGAPADTVDKAIIILDDCEMARFTPAHSDTEMDELYKKAVTVIKEMESQVKK